MHARGRMLRLLAPLALVLGACFQETVDDTVDGVFPSPPEGLCRNGELEGAEECDDGNATSGDGCSASCEAELPVVIAWQISTLAGAPVACPSNHDAELLLGNERVVLPCEGGPLRRSLVRGNYSATVRIVDRTTQVRWGESETIPFAVVSSAVLVRPRIVSDAGWLGVGWSFRNAADIPVDCGVAGVATVRTTAVPAGGGTPIELVAECAKYGAVSPLLLAGTYDVSIGTSLHPAVTIAGVIIEPRARTTLLPVVLRP